MNNEINKKEEDIDNKSNIDIKVQKIIGFLLFAVVVFIVYIVVLSLGVEGGGGMATALVIAMAITFFFVGVVGTSVAVGTSSFVKLVKSNDKTSLLEEKTKKKWLMFNIFSFLIIPVGTTILFHIFDSAINGVFLSFLFVVLMSGINILLKNKNNNRSDKVLGWFLTVFGGVALISIAYSLVFK